MRSEEEIKKKKKEARELFVISCKKNTNYLYWDGFEEALDWILSGVLNKEEEGE